MKVILLQNVPKVGLKYEIKEVAGGYASNYLLPNRLAEVATKSKINSLEVLRKRHEQERKVQAELLEKNFSSLEKAQVSMSAKANEQGHLFQGIHEDEIVAALKEQAQIDIEPSMIKIEKAIKEVGDIDIPVEVGGKSGTFTLTVESA
jgi:large subunit ribosomal protein L9